MVERGRELRSRETDAEAKLWAALRSRQVRGVKFRRQHPVGVHVLDFFSYEVCLAIELDGGQHFEDGIARYDEQRTRDLAACGIRVLRFSNVDVLFDLPGVLERIDAVIDEASPPHPNPLPLGEGIGRTGGGV